MSDNLMKIVKLISFINIIFVCIITVIAVMVERATSESVIKKAAFLLFGTFFITSSLTIYNNINDNKDPDKEELYKIHSKNKAEIIFSMLLFLIYIFMSVLAWGFVYFFVFLIVYTFLKSSYYQVKHKTINVLVYFIPDGGWDTVGVIIRFLHTIVVIGTLIGNAVCAPLLLIHEDVLDNHEQKMANFGKILLKVSLILVLLDLCARWSVLNWFNALKLTCYKFSDVVMTTFDFINKLDNINVGLYFNMCKPSTEQIVHIFVIAFAIIYIFITCVLFIPSTGNREEPDESEEPEKKEKFIQNDNLKISQNDNVVDDTLQKIVDINIFGRLKDFYIKLKAKIFGNTKDRFLLIFLILIIMLAISYFAFSIYLKLNNLSYM